MRPDERVFLNDLVTNGIEVWLRSPQQFEFFQNLLLLESKKSKVDWVLLSRLFDFFYERSQVQSDMPTVISHSITSAVVECLKKGSD